jgi:hypothetical protein
MENPLIFLDDIPEYQGQEKEQLEPLFLEIPLDLETPY